MFRQKMPDQTVIVSYSPDNNAEGLPVVVILLPWELVGGGGHAEGLVITSRHAGLPLAIIVNLSIFS